VPEVWFAIPGDPKTLTGGYVYARRLMEALPAAGWSPHLLSWPGSFPAPSANDLTTARASLAALPRHAPVLVDGLAYGTLPTSLLDGLTQRIVALVHHPLALESGLSAAEAERLRVSERAALARANQIVVTSPVTAHTLVADYNVQAHRLHIAVPGTDRAERAQGALETPLILTVGTLTPRKGHDILVQALARISDLKWTTRIVGSTARHTATATDIAALIAQHRLEDRIHLMGEMSGPALASLYKHADVFALASRYEGYGMVFAEALAHGLPIVACAGGAVAETVPPDAGLLAPPGDVDALAAQLHRMLTDHACRKAMADAAWRHGQTLPAWSDTARAVAQALTATVEVAA